MEDVIETKLLEFDKSAFLIDLVKHDSGTLYVKIVQSIYANEKSDEVIKINPNVLSEIIKVLLDYHSQLPDKYKEETKFITEKNKQEIRSRYLKGIPVDEIALQFDTTTELVENIIRNKGIEIVPNQKSRYNKRKRKGKRK